MRQGQAVRNPLAKKASYVFNARLDACNQLKQQQLAQTNKDIIVGPQLTGNCDEIFSVKPYELVFRYIKGGCKTYSDGRNYVFSALNGLPEDAKIDLAGIAVGSSSGVHDRMNAQGFAVERSSINTIMNTGSKKIITGQYVYWHAYTEKDLKALDEKYANGAHLVGVPKHKRCAMVSSAPIRDLSGLEYGRAGYVGQALSSAEPGRPFDVLLEPCPGTDRSEEEQAGGDDNGYDDM